MCRFEKVGKGQNDRVAGKLNEKCKGKKRMNEEKKLEQNMSL